jgi:peptidoglycan hydrolase-like protein with peptidoglycan-binding domain
MCLRWLGYFPNNVDYVSNIGPVTRNALAQFQRVNGLKVTQTLDADTKKALHKLFP